MEICFLIAVIISVGIYVLLSSSLGFLAGVLAIAAFPCLLVGVSQYFDGRSPREKKLRKKFTNFINSYYENSEIAICNLEQITTTNEELVKSNAKLVESVNDKLDNIYDKIDDINSKINITNDENDIYVK